MTADNAFQVPPAIIYHEALLRRMELTGLSVVGILCYTSSPPELSLPVDGFLVTQKLAVA